METVTKTYCLYKFNELRPETQEKAVCGQIEFEIKVMDPSSPFYHCAEEMQKMQTPWFLGEAIYDEHKKDIIKIIKADENNNWFFENGEIVPYEIIKELKEV